MIWKKKTLKNGLNSIYLDITTFVDEFANWFQVRVAPCNVRLSNTQHVDGGFVQLDENTIVDLTQTEQLQNLAHFWCNFVDTENGNERRNIPIKIQIECGDDECMKCACVICCCVLIPNITSLLSKFLSFIKSIEKKSTKNTCFTQLQPISDYFFLIRSQIRQTHMHYHKLSDKMGPTKIKVMNVRCRSTYPRIRITNAKRDSPGM